MISRDDLPETPDWDVDPRDGLTPAQRAQLLDRFHNGMGSRELRDLPERFELGEN